MLPNSHGLNNELLIMNFFAEPIVPRPVSLFSDDDEDELDYGEDDLDEEY